MKKRKSHSEFIFKDRRGHALRPHDICGIDDDEKILVISRAQNKAKLGSYTKKDFMDKFW